MNIDTKIVHGDKNSNQSKTGSISTPIYQSATFKHPALGESTGFDYTRTNNPTREKLEKAYSVLENGNSGIAFTSGMAAIHAILSLFSTGDHVLVCDDLYGGSYRIFNEYFNKYGILFDYVDCTDIRNIQNRITKKTKAIFYETPTNPMMKVANIVEISKLSQQVGLISIVDNTFLTPYFQRPLDLGADIVISSATKYLAGHNDTLCGLVSVKSLELAEKIRFFQNTIGAGIPPFDSWLVLRGMKTLGVRLDRQQQNSFTICDFLIKHKLVKKVYYPGLKGHHGYEISKNQSSGFGGMISFEVESKKVVESILKNVEIISFAESLGGVESLITYPIVQTHSAIPISILNKLGITENLLRLSVGIESSIDLINDLEKALTK